MSVLEIVALGAGIVASLWILSSAVRTMVIPRDERVFLTDLAFELARRASRWRANRHDDRPRRHRILGTFAPVVLVSLPLIWAVGLIASFAAIHWGLDAGSVGDALELSGSSLTTLGFVAAPNTATRYAAIAEALLGLAIVALMISFLPTIYTTFSRREIAVGRLTTRAGEPPSVLEFLTRLHRIERLDRVGDRWDEWELWFEELGETHTTFPALVYFRSTSWGRSWLTAAEAALDASALVTVLELTPRTGQAQTMIRAGYLALRGIADHYRIEPERHPDERDRLAVSRADFDRLLDRLVEAGVIAEPDRDHVWHHWAGWRVNYDRALTGLRELVGDVPSHWDDLTLPDLD